MTELNGPTNDGSPLQESPQSKRLAEDMQNSVARLIQRYLADASISPLLVRLSCVSVEKSEDAFYLQYVALVKVPNRFDPIMIRLTCGAYVVEKEVDDR